MLGATAHTRSDAYFAGLGAASSGALGLSNGLKVSALYLEIKTKLNAGNT